MFSCLSLFLLVVKHVKSWTRVNRRDFSWKENLVSHQYGFSYHQASWFGWTPPSFCDQVKWCCICNYSSSFSKTSPSTNKHIFVCLFVLNKNCTSNCLVHSGPIFRSIKIECFCERVRWRTSSACKLFVFVTNKTLNHILWPFVSQERRIDGLVKQDVSVSSTCQTLRMDWIRMIWLSSWPVVRLKRVEPSFIPLEQKRRRNLS